MNKSLILLCLVFLFACKNQEQGQSIPPTQQDLISISDFTPNPDQVVLFVTLIDKKQLDSGWEYQVEVKRQMSAGFGVKDRLASGDKITLTSTVEVPDGDFYCAADSGKGPEGRTYALKSLLKK